MVTWELLDEEERQMCQEEELAASCGRGLKPGDRFDQDYDQILSSIIDHKSSL